MKKKCDNIEKRLEKLEDFFYEKRTDGEDLYYLDINYAANCFGDDEILKQRMIDFLDENKLTEDAECGSDNYCEDCAEMLFARLWYQFEDDLIRIWYKNILSESNFAYGLSMKREEFKNSLICTENSPESDNRESCLLCGKLLNSYPVNDNYTIDELADIVNKKNITQDDINYVCLILDNLTVKNIKEIELIEIIKNIIVAQK